MEQSLLRGIRGVALIVLLQVMEGAVWSSKTSIPSHHHTDYLDIRSFSLRTFWHVTVENAQKEMIVMMTESNFPALVGGFSIQLFYSHFNLHIKNWSGNVRNLKRSQYFTKKFYKWSKQPPKKWKNWLMLFNYVILTRPLRNVYLDKPTLKIHIVVVDENVH